MICIFPKKKFNKYHIIQCITRFSHSMSFSIMIIPIRCFTCGAMTADKWDDYQDLIKHGKTPEEALDELHIYRFCCRRMFLAHVQLIDKMLPYSTPVPESDRIQ